MLTVEVKGISFANKGAELMLYAIQQEFARRGIAARFVVEPIGDYQRRCNFGLWQKTRYMRKRVNWLAPLQFLPGRMRRMLGLVNENEIDVVLDASGFSYGEQWSPLVAKHRLADGIKGFKRRGAKVLLMPQALGPFECPAHKKYFGQILNHADKVFARDQHSYEYAKSLLAATTDPGVLEQCCDFTNLVGGIEATEFDAKEHQLCFIPNSKMLEKRNDGDAYVAFMVRLMNQAIADNQKPFILIHEAAADRKLAEQIQQQLTQRIPVLDPQHALKIKWIIGQSKLVISSRFHGLVSALSQGVPVIATGWSHKYQELLRDYEVEDWLFDIADQGASASSRMKELLTNPKGYTEVKNRIANNSIRHKQTAQNMWDSIFSIIGQPK